MVGQVGQGLIVCNNKTFPPGLGGAGFDLLKKR